MTATDVDLMDIDRPTDPDRAYRDLDGVDWRLAPHDDQAVFGALRPDAVRSASAATG